MIINKDSLHYLSQSRVRDDNNKWRISKVEENEELEQEQGDNSSSDDLIQFPWDDDSFSLCLDSFPSSTNWAKRFNAYPTTGSPLRKHWKDEEASDDEEEEEKAEKVLSNSGDNLQVKGSSSISSKASSIASVPESAQSDPLPEKKKSKEKKKKKAKLSLFFKKNDNGAFPYNNDTNFLNRIDEQVKAAEAPKQRGHVEYVSPLSSSNLFSNDSLLYRSPISSVRKISSSSSSIKSKSTVSPSYNQFKGYPRAGVNSINSESVISDAASVESWKVVQRPLSGMTSSVVLPSNRQQYKPTPTREYYHFQHPASRSGSVTPSSYTGTRSGASTPLQLPMNYVHDVNNIHYNNNGSPYYNAQPSPSCVSQSISSSYRSVSVPRNADDLVYFSNTPSLYSTDVGSEYTEKSRSYSQFFNPGYHSGNSKRGRSTNKSKRSGSLLAKLVRNIKYHFVKHQAPQESS